MSTSSCINTPTWGQVVSSNIVSTSKMFPPKFSYETSHNVCNQPQKCKGRFDLAVKLLPPRMNSNPFIDGTMVVDLNWPSLINPISLNYD